ncbi:glycoside hydrolase family 9 protein, partial [Fibrobacter sp.]|uniref:glycoside hydrolase family 9 protein n=1 Tax=Fibrobacter sp. TaxID=35828 RepID=UPI0025C71F94
MPIKKSLVAAMFVAMSAVSVMAAAGQEQPTPYDLIRPVWPLTWDTTVFNHYDTTVTMKHNMVPKNRTPASYVPNALIPDTLNQAYLDAINYRMSPIRINQAGYLPSDPEKQFYYVGTATTFEVVDVDGNSLSPAVTGTLTSSGVQTSSDWTIIAGTNAATNDQKRYQLDITGQSGIIQIGHIPGNVPTDTRLRIKVGNDISSTFIVSEKVYSMVRSAALKFYGINRSGYGDSWFHPASHTLDGAGELVQDPEGGSLTFLDMSQAGTLEGGYYDCGDHLKESQTQMYAFMVAAVLAATNPDADEDNYAFNHGETVNTDGIPDMLREAKHGADFVLRSFVRAKGVIDDMVLSVGSFGKDHGWWGRPENQDKLPTDGSAAATGRGGPTTRILRQGEIGAN